MDTENQNTQSDPLTKALRWLVGGILVIILIILGIIGLLYLFTPSAIRNPTSSHYHFRLQIIANAKPVNFGSNAFQTPLNHDICTAALTREPIHFHDNADQFVHIHWAGITGGVLLKNYGWNLIGGLEGHLGFRFDHLPKVVDVPVHGQSLPALSATVHYYIYSGDATGYYDRKFEDFLHLNLDQFFLIQKTNSKFVKLDSLASTESSPRDPRLELNHVVGNAVIFAQQNRPSEEQVKAAFTHLSPLPESVCGG